MPVKLTFAFLIAIAAFAADEPIRTWQGIPGIEQIPRGRMFVAWYSGGSKEPSPENFVVLAQSDDGGKTFTAPEIMAGPRGWTEYHDRYLTSRSRAMGRSGSANIASNLRSRFSIPRCTNIVARCSSPRPRVISLRAGRRGSCSESSSRLIGVVNTSPWKADVHGETGRKLTQVSYPDEKQTP